MNKKNVQQCNLTKIAFSILNEVHPESPETTTNRLLPTSEVEQEKTLQAKLTAKSTLLRKELEVTTSTPGLVYDIFLDEDCQ